MSWRLPRKFTFKTLVLMASLLDGACCESDHNGARPGLADFLDGCNAASSVWYCQAGVCMGMSCDMDGASPVFCARCGLHHFHLRCGVRRKVQRSAVFRVTSFCY